MEGLYNILSFCELFFSKVVTKTTTITATESCNLRIVLSRTINKVFSFSHGNRIVKLSIGKKKKTQKANPDLTLAELFKIFFDY